MKITRNQRHGFDRIWAVCLIVSVGICLAFTSPVSGATSAQYTSLPPFLNIDVPPNVMFMLDNSGSMKIPVYGGRCNTYDTGYNPAKSYFGIFDGEKKYKYDISIGIDLDGYNGSSSAPYEIDADGDGDTDSNDVSAIDGAFVEDSCTPGAGVNCWDGNFLNWMVTRRIDAARKVLVGGKVETRAGYDYDGDSSLEWKIVGNNERSDGAICKQYASGQSYSPYPDSTKFRIESPADAGSSKSTYDPYPKIKAESNFIYDENGVVIGEARILEDFDADANSGWDTITLSKSYSDPVIVATPLSFNGGDPSVVRVSDISSNSFKIRLEEWEYRDGNHTKEDISYLVIEKGSYTLAGGQKLLAGTRNVNDSSWDTVNISSGGFSGSDPIVLSTVSTNNDDDTVTTRTKSVGTTSFKIRLQEEEDKGGHIDEKVNYIVLDKGVYTDGTGTSFQVGTKNVDSSWTSLSFATTNNPSFLASRQTDNDSDPASLRYRSLTTSSVELLVEEEKSHDSEVTHSTEKIGYVIIDQQAEFNLALLVEEEPKGLLHDVSSKVRLGISFYNYKKDSDIYNGEWFHGGTMRLDIPKNPFVKNPDGTNGGGYRSTPVETYVNAGIDKIVDAIEHYPLVWGTTPLAENFYEVTRYFAQETPYFTSTINSGDTSYREPYLVDTTWDPYYFDDPNNDGDTSDSGLVSCAKSYVLLFTDGQPYRDDYLPCYDSSNDTFSDDSASQTGCTDYDGNNSGTERFNTGNTSNKGKNNLDDIVGWAYKGLDTNGNIQGTDRDLRSASDMDGNQNLVTYTVAFGSTTIPDILQNSADNGGGIAYAAEDGRDLKDQLSAAFTDILNRVSGTAASVISNTRSGEGAIYQSIFYPQKTDSLDNKVTWIGQVHALLVDGYGNMREDTNNNQTVEPESDYLVIFNTNGTAYRYFDVDGDGTLSDLSPTDCLDNLNCNQCSTDDSIDCLVDQAYDTSGLTAVDNTISMDDVSYLWNSSKWLNDITDSEAETQRPLLLSSSTALNDSTDERYIFTWVDGDGDGVVDESITDSEIQAFVDPISLTASDLTDTTKIYPYLQLFPSFINTPATISNLSSADLTEFLTNQTRRQINYIRGSDCKDPSDSMKCNTINLVVNGSEVDGTAMRSRQYDYDGDSIAETWRLGDIVYSTPTVVGAPAEAYHLLYRDKSYADFAAQYKERRSIIYVGGNDGMVHAFNGGFYHSQTKTFCQALNPDYDPLDPVTYPPCLTTGIELGAERWAYIPFNLLPHLYWLTEPTYSEEKHVYYVDQKPRIFDARIFPTDSDHPHGWGTIMVIGMRFGGGTIMADIDKQSTTCEDGSVCSLDTTCASGDTCYVDERCSDAEACLVKYVCSDDDTTECTIDTDCGSGATCDETSYCGNGSTCQVYSCADSTTCEVRACSDGSTCEDRQYPESTDITMKSAYMIFDITNPEATPRLLGEISPPNMGFATSYPTMVVLSDDDKDQNYKLIPTDDATDPTLEVGENNWYLVFGSGPADSNGDPGTMDTTTGAYDNKILEEAVSEQKGRLFMVDMKKLATDNELWTLSDAASPVSSPTPQGTLDQGLYSYVTLGNNSFVSDPITVDYNLDFNADVVYFGTISGSVGAWAGKMRRVVIEDDSDATTWIADDTLLDVQQPISAAASVGVDDDGRNWVYFGTGRYFTVYDKSDSSLQSYYGVKEPIYSTSHPLYDVDNPLQKSWASITAPDATRPNGPNTLTTGLINVTNYQVFSVSEVLLYDTSHTAQEGTWYDLETQQDGSAGWYLDFEADNSDSTVTLGGERNLGQAALLGGLLSYTTFTPDEEVCQAGGLSDLWALYYKTGTAHYSSVLGVDDGFGTYNSRNDRAKRSLGDLESPSDSLIKGVATSPSIHTGREKGSAVFVQSSTGEIIRIQEDNPLQTKSGMQSWKLR